jgi:hypothetical protein
VSNEGILKIFNICEFRKSHMQQRGCLLPLCNWMTEGIAGLARWCMSILAVVTTTIDDGSINVGSHTYNIYNL